MYAFVGIAGMAKMSSSKGGVPIPTDALEVMEAPVLRWLYARRRPNQSFDVAFGPELQRLYDEWDALSRKVADGTAQAGDLAAHLRATSHARPGRCRRRRGRCRSAPSPRSSTSPRATRSRRVRILSELEPDHPVGSTDDLRPRLDCAERWMLGYVPAEDRTIVRTEPDAELLGSLDEQQRESLRLLVDGLDEHWSLDGLTHLVYGVPKIQRGIDPGGQGQGPGAVGRPAGLLRAGLPAARRQGHRPAAAHPAARRRRRPRPHPPRPLTTTSISAAGQSRGAMSGGNRALDRALLSIAGRARRRRGWNGRGRDDGGVVSRPSPGASPSGDAGRSPDA